MTKILKLSLLVATTLLYAEENKVVQDATKELGEVDSFKQMFTYGKIT